MKENLCICIYLKAQYMMMWEQWRLIFINDASNLIKSFVLYRTCLVAIKIFCNWVNLVRYHCICPLCYLFSQTILPLKQQLKLDTCQYCSHECIRSQLLSNILYMIGNLSCTTYTHCELNLSIHGKVNDTNYNSWSVLHFCWFLDYPLSHHISLVFSLNEIHLWMVIILCNIINTYVH